MSKTYYIYKITNILSGKIYIGQTIQPKRRWYDHKYYAKHQKTNQYIHKAMNKHGINNFAFQIIAEYKSKEECDQAEKDFIDKLNTRNKKFGYNLKPGGRKRGGWTHSEETKRKLSENWKEVHGKNGVAAAHEANRGRKLSERHIEAIKTANIGSKRLIGHKQLQKTINKRIATMSAKYGSKVCSVDDCNRTDGYKYDGNRYCNKHVQRLIRTGTTDKLKRIPWNKKI